MFESRPLFKITTMKFIKILYFVVFLTLILLSSCSFTKTEPTLNSPKGTCYLTLTLFYSISLCVFSGRWNRLSVVKLGGFPPLILHSQTTSKIFQIIFHQLERIQMRNRKTMIIVSFYSGNNAFTLTFLLLSIILIIWLLFYLIIYLYC